jgi:hypothetical protein
MHYSLMGKMRLPFIDSELLYRGAIKAGLTVCILPFPNKFDSHDTAGKVLKVAIHIVYLVVRPHLFLCVYFLLRKGYFTGISNYFYSVIIQASNWYSEIHSI